MGIKKETGEERTFGTGARKQHSTGKGTPVLVPGDAILDVAKHFEDGAVHYGPRNWEKGIPISELLNSAERHLQQIKMGLTDESHDRAFVWNAIVYLATKLRIEAGILPKELDDMPRYNRYHSITWKINKGKLGWYVVNLENDLYYLHRDLTVQNGTGGRKNKGGNYETKKLAEETLQAYLNEENRHGYCEECYTALKNAKDGEAVFICEKCKNIRPDDTYKEKQFKYMCDDCQYKFNTPVDGAFKPGTDLLLNGCPECGCSSYSEIGNFQYPDLCDECAEQMKNAKQWEAVELCKKCTERMV